MVDFERLLPLVAPFFGIPPGPGDDDDDEDDDGVGGGNSGNIEPDDDEGYADDEEDDDDEDPLWADRHIGGASRLPRPSRHRAGRDASPFGPPEGRFAAAQHRVI